MIKKIVLIVLLSILVIGCDIDRYIDNGDTRFTVVTINEHTSNNLYTLKSNSPKDDGATFDSDAYKYIYFESETPLDWNVGDVFILTKVETDD